MAPSPQCSALNAAISRKGISYKDLATQMGTSEQHIIDVCTGSVTATSGEFNNLAKVLGISDVPPHSPSHLTK
ncbi:hypothetical protein FA95DRAFT_1557037 [Auriscalpium vulgare]|uniref:Uncharacterized protein n=1 Tax=Auriscalpium vulgare TaxID=40419 RepID=A0ACB8RYY2_9AGAM|nr:hypothetical protein FA95DRAFT_1557037 [Auriscalpium vulgare]